MYKLPKQSKHKQSRYFTLMLVPYSSGKTRSLRIPHFVFYLLSFILVCTICTVTIFYIRTNYFKSKAEEINSNLQQTKKLNNILQQDRSKLTQDRDDLDKLLQEAENKKEEQVAKEVKSFEQQMDYYEQKAKELEEKLNELERAKEEIYNQLSLREYVPQVRLSSYDLPMTPVFTSTNVGSFFNPDLDTRYASLDMRISEEMLSFDDLKNDLEEIKPYLSNYPTVWPVWGIATSEVGYRQNPFGGTGDENHTGIDLSVPMGTDVKASGGGVVTFSGYTSGYGYLVIINHGMGIESYYAHNSNLLVEEGDTVSRRQIIAKSGSSGYSTGPHVHFEVRVNGVIKNPRNYVREAF